MRPFRTTATLSVFALSLGLSTLVACKKDEPAPAKKEEAANKGKEEKKDDKKDDKKDEKKDDKKDDKKKAKGTKEAPKKLDVPADKKPNPVPADWEHMENSAMGFAFSVPKGTKDHQDKKGGRDIFVAMTPKPHEILVYVAAWKDASKTKDDLLKEVTAILVAEGEKDVAQSSVVALNDDYSTATVTSTGAKGEKTKCKALVATDVTDNYVMLVCTDDKDFAANEKTVDEIWGSFEMYSGGASGTSK